MFQNHGLASLLSSRLHHGFSIPTITAFAFLAVALVVLKNAADTQRQNRELHAAQQRLVFWEQWLAKAGQQNAALYVDQLHLAKIEVARAAERAAARK